MKSSFFYNGHCTKVAEQLKDYINNVPEFLSEQTARSTRAVGDAIENIIADKFDTFLGDWCKEYSSNFARRAMADVAFKDKDDFYCVVDIKTHRKDTSFNMPNLTSVERLSRFYEDDRNVVPPQEIVAQFIAPEKEGGLIGHPLFIPPCNSRGYQRECGNEEGNAYISILRKFEL